MTFILFHYFDIGIADKIDLRIGADFLSCQGDKPNAAEAMWRIEGAERTKKMRQDGAAEFISASYHLAYRILQRDTIVYLLSSSRDGHAADAGGRSP